MEPRHEAPVEWWRAFFTESFGALQQRGLQDAEAVPDADFLEKALRVEPGQRLLDVPCGAGRHAIELAARGYRVTGVDFNPGVLEAARRRADERGVEVDLREGDLRELHIEGAFDAAFCYWGSFGYFDEPGDRRFVDGVFRALRPGGRFLIETHVAETLLPRFQPRDWIWWGEEPDRVRVLQERSWNLDTGRIECTWTFVRDDEVRESASSTRIYSVRELRSLLGDAGFTGFEALETRTGEPFGLGSSRLSLVATRPAAAPETGPATGGRASPSASA